MDIKKQQQDYLKSKSYSYVVSLWDKNSTNDLPLNQAFVWVNTPEGSKFWNHVDEYLFLHKNGNYEFEPRFKLEGRWV